MSGLHSTIEARQKFNDNGRPLSSVHILSLVGPRSRNIPLVELSFTYLEKDVSIQVLLNSYSRPINTD